MAQYDRQPCDFHALAVAVAVAATFTSGAPAATPTLYSNCSHLNTRYPHGVGKAGARDRVKGLSQPVTTFTRSTATYKRAITYTPRLDADRDGVACEKA